MRIQIFITFYVKSQISKVFLFCSRFSADGVLKFMHGKEAHRSQYCTKVAVKNFLDV